MAKSSQQSAWSVAGEMPSARCHNGLTILDGEIWIVGGRTNPDKPDSARGLVPLDEVIVFDPYFVMYDPLVQLVGGRTVVVDTYPTFHVDVERVTQALTPRTKMILFNSPANPTGVVASAEEVKALAELAAQRDILLVSDEIYRQFCYD